MRANTARCNHVEDKALYVLEGNLTIIWEEDSLGYRWVYFLPRGVPHGSQCSSRKDSRVRMHVMPGMESGFVGMMLEMTGPFTGRILPEPAAPDLQT